MDLKRSYREDLRLCQGRAQWVALIILLVGLAVVPFVIQDYFLNIACQIAVYAIVTIGLNILVGYTGQISLGHAGFFAIGAYTQAILIVRHGWTWWMALPASGVSAAAFGVILALPALRLTGPYLAIATLGFGMAVTQIIGHTKYFGGRDGIQVPTIEPVKEVLTTDQWQYVIIMTIAVVLTIAAVNLMKSRLGRAMVAVRDSDIAAETMGINLLRTKAVAFAVSGFYTGVAGALMAHLLTFINPESFNLLLSIQFLAMVVVGGLGSILGSILGAALLTLLPILLSGVAKIQMIVYGAIMVLVIMVEPHGLRGRWLKIKLYWKRWPF